MALADPRTDLVAPNSADYTRENFEAITGIPSKTSPVPPVLKFDPVQAQTNIQTNLNSLRAYSPSKAVNPYQLGKEKLFGAGLNHHQFERYYEHPLFDTLGFSPFRNNEELYNKNSNWGQEMWRAAGEWSTLTSLGLKDAFGFGSLVDTEAAKKYERAMAIGNSTKGGIGGFTTNLFLNSGYTVGIMGEMILEEVGLALLTAGTLGSAAPLTGPMMALRAQRAFGKIKTGLSAGQNILKALDNLQDVNKARQYFMASGKSVANFINPLEQGTDFLRNMDKLDGLGALKSVSTGVGAFYRDVRNARLVYGESALEGGFVQNQMEEELLNAHYAKHDRPPTDEEAAAIKQTSIKAGASTSIWNMPVIHLSNKMVFDNMFKTFNPVRRLTQGAVSKNMAGEIVESAAKKDAFAFVENTVKGRFKNALNVKRYPSRLLSYGKANIAEGLQESFQEVIAGTTHAYYTDQYNGSTRGGVYSYIGDNIKKQFSPEGGEIFLSGFLMGGLVQGPQKIVSKGFAIGQAGGFKGYAEQKAKQKEEMLKTVNTLNEMYNDPTKYFAPDLENLVNQEKSQKGMAEANKSDDPMMYHDMKDQSVYDHITTAMQLDKMDTFYQRLEEMKALAPEEFKQAFPGFTQDSNTSAAIDKVIARAKNIEKRYTAFQKQFPNNNNPSQYKYGSEEYNEAARNKIAHDTAVKEAVFMQASFDRTLERMTATQAEIKDDSQLSKVLTSDFNSLFTIADTQNEIKTIKAELSGLENVTITDPQTRKYKAEKQAKLKALEGFSEAMDKFQEVSGASMDDSLSPDAKLAVTKEKAKAINVLYKEYGNYLRTLAKVSGDHVFDVNLENSFQKLLDFYALNDRSNRLTVAVNALTDPKGFTRLRARIDEAMKFQYDNRKANIQVALDKYNEIRDKNELLGKLYDANMFFDPSQMDALLKDGIMPDNFFYAEGPNKLDEVDITSEDYAKAELVISDFVKNVMGRQIREAKLSPYDFHQRNKNAGDKRTYSDLAAEYGFDPKAAESKVPLKQVLQSVVDSKFVSKRELALAKRLLILAQDGETVTFSKTMGTAGEYTPSTQTRIDARYSAADFKGTGIPIEVNILRQEVHRQASAGLANDNKFRSDMQKLYDAIVAVYNEKAKDRDLGPQLGLKSLEDFIAEAMINPQFQMLMASVPYAAQTKQSTWTEFVNSISRLLKRFFGKNSTNTALNAAVDIITTKFDARPESTAKTTGTTISTKAVVEQSISNGDKIIRVQTKPVTDEITETEGELFLSEDKNPEGKIYINMEPLKDILVIPNNTLTVIDKKTGTEIVNQELNPEGAVIFEAMQGRLFVVANINGQLVPFYKSSAGTSGKTQGDWYPFFGYTGNWLVKGGIDKATGKMSYSPEIDNVTELLNKNLIFPDHYIGRETNTITNTDGTVIVDMNKFFKINRLGQKRFQSQTGTKTDYQIKGLKEDTTSEAGVVALITGLNPTELHHSGSQAKNLSEWFTLINNNIAQKPSTVSTVAPAGPQEIVPIADEIITVDTVFDVINEDTPSANILRDTLLKEYKAYNRSQFEKDEPTFDSNWAKKSDAEILKSKGFRAYATTTTFSKVKEAIKVYNTATGRTVAPQPKATVNAPTIKTSGMISALTNLGYTPEDVDAMNPAEAQAIIDAGTKKPEVAPVVKVVNSDVAKKRLALSNYISKMTADTLGEVQEKLDALLKDTKRLKEYQLSTDKTPYSVVAWIEEMFENKRADLAFEVTFDKLNVNDEVTVVITNKDGSKYDVQMIIDSKSLVDITLHKVGDKEFTRKINKNQVAEEIKYARYNKLMDDVKITPETVVTPEETVIVNTDFKTAQGLTDEDSLKEDREKAASITRAEAQKDLLDDIEAC